MKDTDQPKPAIEVKGLRKTFHLPHERHSGIKQKLFSSLQAKSPAGYEVQEVLKDVSFTVYEGDFFGVVGRNGSGKSTLLKTMAGIYSPDAGRVKLHGSLVPFIELGVGFNPELTGRENVYLNGALLGFSRKEMDVMYDEIVEFAELERFMDQKLKNYSSGMQVRLAFSIAIRAQGDILLLDEVLAVGDSAFQQKCFDYFDQLKKDKKTVILVTHSMSNVERFCNRGLLLNDGKIETIGSSDEVASAYRDLFDSGINSSTKSVQKNTANHEIEVLSTQVIQGGEKVYKVKQGKRFEISFNLRLLNKEYQKHNVSVSIRNKQDLSIAFMTTMDAMPKYFDVDERDFVVNFLVKDNIYNRGEYYIDISVRSSTQDVLEREVILDSKHVTSFEVDDSYDRRTNSVTIPNVDISIEGATVR